MKETMNAIICKIATHLHGRVYHLPGRGVPVPVFLATVASLAAVIFWR
jgi:hypothetical protein